MTESDEVCAICLENMDSESENKHTLTQCNHTFHASCLVKWVLSPASNARRCPSCRSDEPLANSLDYMTIQARTTYILRSAARRKDASPDLLRVVKNMKASYERAKQASKAEREFSRENAHIIKKWRQLRSARWRAHRKASAARRLVGCYSSNSFPLPGLLVNGALRIS